MARALLLCVLLVVPVFGDLNVLLLHTNDMHSRFQQTDRYSGICESDASADCYGGFARLHSEVTQRRAQAAANGRPTIFLNAGDTFQGTPFYTFYKWKMVAKFVDMLGIDVMSLGNHEFDDGVSDLSAYIQNVSVPNVCCNLDISREPSLNSPNLTPSKVLNVGGVKIGVIGYLTPDTKTLSKTGNVDILDEVVSIRSEARNLLSQGVKILIAVGHSGYIRDQEIAEQVEEIDVVVGGHSHTFLYTGTPPDVEKPKGPYPTVVSQASGKKVPVVQAYFATKYLGYLELDFDDEGNLKNFNGLPILLSGKLPQDPEILSALKPYEQETSAQMHKIVGYSEVLLDNIDFKCKMGECNVGNLVTDAYVDYVARHYPSEQGWTIASIGLNQAGGIRASIDKASRGQNGSVSLEDVITVIPWGGKVVVHNVTGAVLKQALEYSVARYEETITGHVSEFLQVSGLHVSYNMSRPSGGRVSSVTALCADCSVPVYRPLEAGRVYGVVMPEYLSGGGDNFTMFKNLSDPIVLDDVDYVVVADYITAHSPVHPAVEGRIVVTGTASRSGAPPATAHTPRPLVLGGLLIVSVIRFSMSRS